MIKKLSGIYRNLQRMGIFIFVKCSCKKSKCSNRQCSCVRRGFGSCSVLCSCVDCSLKTIPAIPEAIAAEEEGTDNDVLSDDNDDEEDEDDDWSDNDCDSDGDNDYFDIDGENVEDDDHDPSEFVEYLIQNEDDEEDTLM